MIYGIEFGLVLVALALAFSFPSLGSRWFEAVSAPWAGWQKGLAWPSW